MGSLSKIRAFYVEGPECSDPTLVKMPIHIFRLLPFATFYVERSFKGLSGKFRQLNFYIGAVYTLCSYCQLHLILNLRPQCSNAI